MADKDEVSPTEESDSSSTPPEPVDPAEEPAELEESPSDEPAGTDHHSAEADQPDDIARSDEADDPDGSDDLDQSDEADQSEDPDGSDDLDGSDDGDLVPVGAVPAKRKTSAADTGKQVAERGRKDKATPKREPRADKPHRTSPVTFVRESVAELRKVVYPTGQQLVNYFVVVLIFVLFIIAFVSLLDLAFGWAMFRIFA